MNNEWKTLNNALVVVAGWYPWTRLLGKCSYLLLDLRFVCADHLAAWRLKGGRFLVSSSLDVEFPIKSNNILKQMLRKIHTKKWIPELKAT